MSKELLERLSKLTAEKSETLRRERLLQENKDRATQFLLSIKLTMNNSSSVQVQYK